jgi:NADH-quinone oxidoreductase subunit G/NADP-reducing hydrogenase subunit HndD
MDFNISVNRSNVKVTKGETILSVLKRNGVSVPTLCHMPELSPSGACRLCVVELLNQNKLVPACSTFVAEGMEVLTHSKKVLAARKTLVELLLTDHPENCLYCDKNGNCELQDLAENLNIRERSYVGFALNQHPKTDRSSPDIVRDQSKCILCGRCVRICDEILGVSAIDLVNRGNEMTVETIFQRGLYYSNCVHCGLCITACPTGAILEKTNLVQIIEKINNPDKTSGIILSNSTIAGLAVHFNLKKFDEARNFLIAALHDIGFKSVSTIGFGNEIFISEQASRVVERTKERSFPMIISDCPAILKYLKSEMPGLYPYVSKIQSPQQILGQTIKMEPEKADIQIFSAPCVAHKYDAAQQTNQKKGSADIDYVISGRELLKLLKTHGIVLPYLRKDIPDKPSNSDTSAAALFETKGGISETILRELFFKSGAQKYPKKIFEVKAEKAFVEYEFELNGVPFKIASVHGIETIKQKKNELIKGDYLFIEIRSCSVGCINGCGQIQSKDVEFVRKIKKIITDFDETNINDTAGKNPYVKGFYKQSGKERLFDYD